MPDGTIGPAPWPRAIWVARHGQSEGNLARDAAYAAGAEIIDAGMRDPDAPLTPLGRRQAEALGRVIAQAAVQERPTRVLASPYLRARESARLALAAAGLDVPVGLDERLRDREFGVLDRLTGLGITRQHPEEAQRRGWLGKFWHRPPGGESWADVALRVRAVLVDLRLDAPGERVLLVAHDVVVLILRYLLEDMTEQEVLGLQRDGLVHNGGLTVFDGGAALGRPRLASWNTRCL